MKRPRDATPSFPWRCPRCGKDAVEVATIKYAAEVRHDGRLHTFTIPALQIPMCRACGEKVFTEDVERQVNDALRLHLTLFTPDKIRDALNRVRLSQKEVAERLGIAPATISRWLNEDTDPSEVVGPIHSCVLRLSAGSGGTIRGVTGS